MRWRGRNRLCLGVSRRFPVRKNLPQTAGDVGRDHGFAAVFLLPEKALIIGAISLMRAVHCSIACLCIASSSVSLAR